MIRHPPRTTRSDPLFPYRTPVRATDHEVLRLRVGEVPPGDRSPRPHRHPLCELDAGVGSDIEQLPERPLLGVLGAGRIAGCRTDDAILLRSEEHTSELQHLMRISYAAFGSKKKQKRQRARYI